VRNISFFLTTKQFLDGTKDVTRRKGWAFLKGDEHLMAVEKGQGLKKGEKVRRLGEIVVIKAEREPLRAICDHPGDCAREGFPGMVPMDFIQMYCEHNGGGPGQMVTRIEFDRVKA
jgi:hypothetical protein